MALSEDPTPGAIRSRRWREGNPGNVYDRDYNADYAANIDAKRERAKEAAFQRQLKRFGLTEEDYVRLSALGCAVCGALHGGIKNGREKRLHMDHDHETDEFRGLLCHNCNTALGLLGDDSDRLLALVLYLEKSP